MTPQRHIVALAADAEYTEATEYAGHHQGLGRWSIVDESHPSAVHTGFTICRLEAGGSIDAHVHSFEESLYVIEGELVVEMPGAAVHMRPGDYGLFPVGVEHKFRNTGDQAVRWAEMLAPQPRSSHGGDTYFVPDFETPDPVEVDVRDPRTRLFGHIDPENMLVDQQTQDRLSVSASMRTALLVYSGITVKMMVDTDLGAQLSTMFMVQYEPNGFAGAHDHPLEESYLILDGGVDAKFDGVEYRLEAGDVAWAGVGCVHEFANPGTDTVMWLETQAPGPPARHTYRFSRDWRYLEDRLDS
ncbi:MAG TPA: cupin domain-containing protein [Acidimicrobiia bacterium]|jgi:quercetin dioxygenase-like cupin family protein